MSDRSLSFFDGSEWTVRHKGLDYLSYNYFNFTIDQDGELWFFTEKYIRHTFEGKTWVNIFEFKPPLNDGYTPPIYVDTINRIWWVTSKIYRIYDKETGEQSIYDQRTPDFDHYSIAAVSVDIAHNEVWTGTKYQGILFSNDEDIIRYTRDDGLLDNHITYLTEDNEGDLWVGTKFGLCMFDGQDFTTIVQGTHLNENRILDIAIDHNNTVWFSHYAPFQLGLISSMDQSTGSYIQYYIDDYGYLERYDLMPLLVDHNGDVWTGGSRTKIHKHVNGEFIPYTMGVTNIFGQAVSMVEDRENTIWIAVSYQDIVMDHSGIRRFNGTTFDDGISMSTHNMAYKNDRLALASWRNGIATYDHEDWTWYTIENGLPDNMTGSVAIDEDNVLWAGTSTHDEAITSVIMRNTGRFEWETFTVDNYGHAVHDIREIVADRNNTMWFATDTGVLRYDGDWSVYTTENSGLPHNEVNAIAVAPDNTIWFGTADGAVKYTGETITAVDKEPKPEALPIITTWPNPFNPSTTISFTLPESGHTTLTVFNLAGQTVRTLADEPMTAGNHTVVWDGHDDAGNNVAVGVYVTKLEAGGAVATGKMVLVK